MALPKITLSAKTTPTEGAIGTYLITLDTAAPAGGLKVFYNTAGSTAAVNSDYNFTAGPNLSAVTASSFIIAAGAKTATLNLVAYTDTVTDPNETVVVNLAAGTGYELTGTSAQFAPSSDFIAGYGPTSVTVADFNSDGNTDLVTANYSDNTISMLWGNGSGGVTGGTSFAVGFKPDSVAVADFNGDGNADLATANSGDNNVLVYLGNGRGGFIDQTNVAVGLSPTFVAVADFNGDGNADLATANYDSDTVSVRLGNGNGGFAAGTNFAVGVGAYALAVADFNGDGNADLVTANGLGNDVSVLLGKGNGGFAPGSNFAVGAGPYSVAVADFNGDGNMDLATANYDGDTVSVRLGNGNGGFAGGTNFAVGVGPLSIAVADVNGDGKADLATANSLSDNVSLLLGNGSGGFAAKTNVAVGTGPTSVSVADFNGDGKADLATANSTNGSVSVLLNTTKNAGGAMLTIIDVPEASPSHQQFVTKPFIAIPDAGAISSTLNVNGMSGPITDLNVSVNIDHSWDMDLDVYLVTPSGQQIELFTDVGGGGSNFTNTILDNEASMPIANGSAPFIGSYRPEGDLASAYGIDPNGIWTLKVSDDSLLNVGVLNSWTLDISTLPSNHAPTGSVIISDTTPKQGQTLTVSDTLADTDGLGVIKYSWLVNGLTVGTGSDYTVTASDVGETIAVTASYTDDLGNAESVSSDSTSAVIAANNPATGTVSISDTTPQTGQVLTASSALADLDGLGTISYTWKAGATVLGAGKSYTVTADEIGKAISVTASYTDDLGNAESVSSDSTSAVIAANNPATGTVSISDTTPQTGQVLTASSALADLDGLGTISYTWKAGAIVLGAGKSYTVTADEIGKAISVTASYTDDLGNAESVSSDSTTAVIAANNPATGTVSISDTTPQQGQTLTASSALADLDGLGTISYTWKTGTTVLGTGNSYLVTASEVGKTIGVTASYTDDLGNAESVSSEATSVVVVAPAAKPGVTLQLLSADSNTSEGNALVDGTAGAVVQYGVTLNTAPVAKHSVTIDFSSNDLTEGTVTPSLTFTSSNWNQAQTLVISGVDDLLNDGNVSYTISATIDTNKTDTLEYLTITIPTFSLQNIDDIEDVPINDGTSGNIGTDGVDYMQGNNGDDQLYGGYGYDELKGGLGNDELYGEQGNDRLYGELGNDTLYGGYQNDKLYGDEGDDTLWGEEGADSLEGGVGNDTLDGGTGLDTLVGGAGNDTYYLGYDAVDVITDNGLSTDVDTVIMPYQLSKYTLPSGIENGTIAEGTEANSLTGNTGDNTLTGNAGKNKLVGAVGRDSLFGGLGEDVLNGGTGNDVLEGGKGKDNLTGGAGNDTFLFNTALKASVDKIIDFKPADDTIELENQIFSKLTATGTLSTGNFVTATAAADSNDYLVYNKATGALFYDADGNGAGAAVQIALLGTNLALTNADFVVI
ncbi:MAG: hypothetical protein EPN17_01670 [Methylobacter sp.]|nr:MAG: hypothetical protein EPN17_01670 [Methylobacter sp.]